MAPTWAGPGLFNVINDEAEVQKYCAYPEFYIILGFFVRTLVASSLVTLRGTDEESDDDRLPSSRPPRNFSAFFNRITCHPRIALNGSFLDKNEFAQKKVIIFQNS